MRKKVINNLKVMSGVIAVGGVLVSGVVTYPVNVFAEYTESEIEKIKFFVAGDK